MTQQEKLKKVMQAFGLNEDQAKKEVAFLDYVTAKGPVLERLHKKYESETGNKIHIMEFSRVMFNEMLTTNGA